MPHCWGPAGFGAGGTVWWVSMVVSMALLWALLLAGLVVLIRWAAARTPATAGAAVESPLDILKKRYARGEIGRDEYERLKQDLS